MEEPVQVIDRAEPDAEPAKHVVYAPGEDAANDIVCGICKKNFTDPRVLPCLHSFCSRCVKGAVKDGNYDCFHCGHPVPASSIDSLPVNFWAIIMIEKIGKEQEARVDPCGKPAVSFCDACKNFLCGDCVDLHKVHPLFKAHGVVSLEDFDKRSPALHREVLCTIHPTKVQPLSCLLTYCSPRRCTARTASSLCAWSVPFLATMAT